MSDKINKKAIVSVADKNGIVELCRELEQMGFELIATGGTQKLLGDGGIKAVKISDYTGGSESERVKTLSQRIAREILETGEIGLVICNLYPFFAQQGKSIDEMIEFVDIGGVTLIRAGAKNFKKVGVVYDPDQYTETIRALKEDRFDEGYRLNLARKAFDYIAWYDSIIASYFTSEFTERTFFSNAGKLFMPMRYGENPHQKAAFFLNPLQQAGFRIHGGKQISYNNLLDAEVAVNAAIEFKDDQACAIIKHQTPCGVALGSSQAEAFERAYTADSVSAFGGIVGLNRPVEPSTAELITKYFFEVIIAPNFDARAIEKLQMKKNLRLVEVSPALLGGTNQRSVFNGMLVQDKDTGVLGEWQVVTKRKPTEDEANAMKFAWKVVKWTKSNSIVFAVKGRTVGIGAGQTSRVGAVELAAKAAANQDNMVMASDAFFPFRDGIDVAAKAGVKAVIQPGGSKRDQESIDACNEHDMAMVFTGMRHFRH